MAKQYDFSGWATRNDIRCKDGRTIRRNAFIEQDGIEVPLIWNHQHREADNVLGHALLENREDGVYCYGSFNDTAEGQRARTMVKHGDIKYLSIFANDLEQTSRKDVIHGAIREVSLVLAGANPGAYICTKEIMHSDDYDQDETFSAVIYTDEEIVLAHSDEEDEKPPLIPKKKKGDEAEEETPKAKEEPDSDEGDEAEGEEPETEDDEDDDEEKKNIKHSDDKEDNNMADKEKTVQDVFNEFTEDQKNVVYYMITEAVKAAKGGADGEAKHSDDYDEEDYLMHQNIFESPEDAAKREFLMHADSFFKETDDIFKEAKRCGSLKEACLAHAASNNIVDDEGNPAIDWLFPDPKELNTPPEWINIPQEFVEEFMARVTKRPFSRIKSTFADITEAEARAKGYTKGNLKMDEVFSLLRRVTTPWTVYKKQTLDRDDVIDITDFDVVAWLKAEMQVKLKEELVRAFLVGDGRSNSQEDKINETCIRPIWTDSELFTVEALAQLSAEDAADDNKVGRAIINAAIRARKDYRGTGNPDFYTTEDTLTTLLLMTDTTGRDLFDTVDKLTTKLRVRKIITTEVLENKTRTIKVNNVDKTVTLVGIIVNPADYSIGMDKGGQTALFDDFDIDYNKQKYLIETRCSGALTKPYSAIIVEMLVNPT